MDGTAERILPDEALGWHAGNWDINCRSVCICLDNDYEDQDPDESVLAVLSELIKREYPHIKASQILGHQEVKETECPGKNYQTWKTRLFAMID